MKVSDLRYSIWYWCPGCKTNHRIVTPNWDYNGSPTYPTFSPSVLVDYGDGRTCHHFVRNGKIEYLSDCFHELRGTTVEMEDFDRASSN